LARSGRRVARKMQKLALSADRATPKSLVFGGLGSVRFGIRDASDKH